MDWTADGKLAARAHQQSRARKGAVEFALDSPATLDRTLRERLCSADSRLVESLLRHEDRQVNDSVGIAPLVVVPGENFDEIAIENLGHRAVDNR